MTDIFGDVIIAKQLENKVLQTLESWFPVYTREMEIQQNLDAGVLPLPRAFITTDKIERENTDQLPAIVCVSPGISKGSAPKQEGDGTFRVPWAISIGVFVGGRDRSSTHDLVRYYTGVCRMIMIQKQSLSGFGDGTTWLDESYDDNFGFVDQQTIGAGAVTFEIWVANAIDRRGGPASYGQPTPDPDPDTQPGATWPEVEEVIANIRVEGGNP